MPYRTLAFAMLLSCALRAQTTQGLISGSIIDGQTGTAVSGATVTYEKTQGSVSGRVESDRTGHYSLPLLSPGLYRIRVEAPTYQAQELNELDLAVAAQLDLTFRLRPLTDVWEQGQVRSVFFPGSESVLTFFGPDLDTSRSAAFDAERGVRAALESTVSDVIDPETMRRLPLASRDLYATLVTQAGVTADTATGRGLGLAINGQRPSASNFLLDGLENNNYLITGPLTAVAPEAVTEYRVSTNNFSAEYGRTSGYLANAVTRSGTTEWHSTAYYYAKNEAFNANGFQQNRQGFSRAPLKETQAGLTITGPIPARRMFVSGAFEALRYRSRFDPQIITVPSTRFAPGAGSLAKRLLDQFPAPPATDGDNPVARVTVSRPAALDRILALPRLDGLQRGGARRWFARAAIARQRRPEFRWSPYKDFSAPLTQTATSVAGGLVDAVRPNLVNELKAGWSRDDLRMDRPHPEIPSLGAGELSLPGSSDLYSYRNRSRSWEALDNVVWITGAHVIKAGGGLLVRRLDGYLTAGLAGGFAFSGIQAFAQDQPNFVYTALSRQTGLPMERSAYDREYRYQQFFGFVQDSWKLAPRLVVNLGLRYERFGVPSNTGTVKDAEVEWSGTAATLAEGLTRATLVFPGPGTQQLYAADNNNWAGRLGFSWGIDSGARTVIRGGLGIFYDRPFDNLWQNLRNNNFVLGAAGLFAGPTDYLSPITSSAPFFGDLARDDNFSPLTLYQPGMRDPYVTSYFFGLQKQLSSNLSLEVNTLGSASRKLIATDQVNRDKSVPGVFGNARGRFNPALPSIFYRSNQGGSSYNALTVTARYRPRHGLLQMAYTYGHTIDNQSEPLAGDFFNLASTAGRANALGSATFTRQFDSRVDRASSDFDQRHNFVFFSYWDLPGHLRGWSVSQMAAFRSGFPFSVNVANDNTGVEYFLNNRAILADPSGAVANGEVAGGLRLLSAAAFRLPRPGELGTLGRNAFAGPGLFSVDVSLGRTFSVNRLSESARVAIRADAFNLLNHANLNNPDSRLGSRTFGEAQFGRRGRDSGFPLITPFNETARQIQVMLRLEF